MISLAGIPGFSSPDFLLTPGQRLGPPIDPADDTDDVEDNTDYGDDGGEGVELFVTVKISERPVDANECPTREKSKETERSKHP